MRHIIPSTLEKGRIRTGLLGSNSRRDGLCGAFEVIGPRGRELRIIASDDQGWEHVSVSLTNRTPNWGEMCFIKDLFWHEDETVVQYHPRKADYINCHPFCLHLWKPTKGKILTPPSHLVGPKT